MSLITVFLHNLASAVLVGVIISSLSFSGDNAKRIRVRKYIDDSGLKHYEIYGPLFFGLVTAFNDKFDVSGDPEEVIIDFYESRVADMSGIEGLNRITQRYKAAGKTVQLAHLIARCRKLLGRANKIVDVNMVEGGKEKDSRISFELA